MHHDEYLKKIDPEIHAIIQKEVERQHRNIELIASENFTSLAVLEAQGSVLTNKYAEGYPTRRWYNGCEHVDSAEQLAIDRAQELFGAEHVNVQPHSGTQANIAVYLALLKPGDTVMALDLACGGHLSHGLPANFSGKFYKFVPYGVDRNTETIDYHAIGRLAAEHKPRMIVAGASAYPRVLDFKKFRDIADSVEAFLFVDMAHIAGLIATGLHPSPIPYADVVTSTTHKTLRGPRGGVIFCKEKYAKKIDSVIFPGTQGGPLMHTIAAKAVAFKEALSPSFKDYQAQIIKNAKALALGLEKLGCRIVSKGTDTHLLLVDLTSKQISGKEAATWLDKAHITTNKNLIPYDTKGPAVTSGLRLGTPAVTTRGMKEREMHHIAELINAALTAENKEMAVAAASQDVQKLTDEFPLYQELWQKSKKK